MASSEKSGAKRPRDEKAEEFKELLASWPSDTTFCLPQRQSTATSIQDTLLRANRVAKCTRMELKVLTKAQNMLEEQLRAVTEEGLLVSDESPLRLSTLPQSLTLMAALRGDQDEKTKKKRTNSDN
mmetsp:Transcript_6459/g.12792  ORF Transcript_6459/g.12792 Transcript_6459/m.12792 type:complete len:126 (+) Transcript_6459:191-568(+)